MLHNFILDSNDVKYNVKNSMLLAETNESAINPDTYPDLRSGAERYPPADAGLEKS